MHATHGCGPSMFACARWHSVGKVMTEDGWNERRRKSGPKRTNARQREEVLTGVVST